MKETRHAIIKTEDWHYSCGEPSCCDEYGTNLHVNGNLITNQFEGYPSEIAEILELFGITSEIEEV